MSGFVVSETTFSLLAVLASAVGFQLLGKAASVALTPSHVKQWRWKNILVSFIHSITSGMWALSCFYRTPKMAEDLISTYDTFSHGLVAYSWGYFLYDSVDMLRFNRSRKSYELLLHHGVIMVCFGIALVSQMYIGYAVVSLIVEINSIFLHSRQLMQIIGVPKGGSAYRLNGLLNLGTYMVFRIATLAWMTRWMAQNRDRVPLPQYTIGSIGLAVLTVMNIVLFMRLLHSDYLRPTSDKEHTKATD